MPVIFHAENEKRAVSVAFADKRRLIRVCRLIDAQGFKAGKLQDLPEYLAEYSLYRIAYTIKSGHPAKNAFIAAYLRAAKMDKPPLPEHIRNTSRKNLSNARKAGRIGNYLRLAKRATVPHLSRTKPKPP